MQKPLTTFLHHLYQVLLVDRVRVYSAGASVAGFTGKIRVSGKVSETPQGILRIDLNHVSCSKVINDK
jgi:hypothetical protein